MSTSTLERTGPDNEAKRRAPIDPRIAARRRQVARDVGKRRRVRLIAFAVVVVTVAAAVGLVQSSALDVDAFEVTATRHVSSEQIVAASQIQLGDPLPLVDAGAIRARLLALPWVDDASVSASWPNALRLVVTERVPVARVLTNAGSDLVDAEGRVLGPATVDPSDPNAPDPNAPDPSASDPNGLVVIEGVAVPEPGGVLDQAGQDALDLVAGLSPGVLTRVEAVVVDPSGQLTLRLRPDMVAQLGPITDLDQKLLALQTALAQVVLDDVETIDLRVPGRFDITRRAAPPDPSATAGGSGAG